ncbi:M-phase phosphoprotein 8 isoform X5 [Vanacampus margaritifer]
MEGQVVKMEPMDSEQDEEENVYEVERIIDMRLEEGEVLYRVRWKGYCSDDDTWEPEGHLEDCREVLLAYKKATIEVKKEPEDRKPILPLPMKSDVFDADSESDSDKDQLTSDMPVVKKKKKKKKSREQQLEDDDEEPPRKEKKKKKKKDKWRDEVKPLPAPETDEDEEEKTTEMKKRLIESEDEDEVPSKKTKKEKSKDGKHRKERCGEEPKKKKSRKEYSIASSDDDLSEGLSDSSVKKEKPRWDEHRSKPKQKPDVKLKGIKDMIQDKKSKLKDSSLLKLKSLTSSKVREDAGPPSSDSSDSSGLHRKGKSKSQEAAPPAKPAPAASKPREDEVAKEDSKGSTNLFETFLLNCEAKDRAPRRPPLDKSASKPSKVDRTAVYCVSNTNMPILRLWSNVDLELKKDFRLTRKAMNSFHKLLRREQDHGWGNEIELLIYTYWLAHGLAYRVVASVFNVPKATVHRIIHRVATNLVQNLKKAISFPSVRKLKEIGGGFVDLSGTPAFVNVVGAIGGYHIPVKPTKVQKKNYLNCKGFHSISMQAICDASGKFFDIFVGYPGSVHNSSVLKNSTFYRAHYFPPPGYILLGDGGYPCLQTPVCLITPYKHPAHGSVQQKFNDCHSRAHSILEKAFGMMKTRWRSTLLEAVDLKPTFAPQVIASCVFLHNVCMDNGDIMDPDEDIAGDDLDAKLPCEAADAELQNETSGNATRDKLAAVISDSFHTGQG